MRLAGGSRWVLLCGLSAAAGGHCDVTASQNPLQVVREVDYQRYAGRWYEIARLPNEFEKDCARNVTATYAVRADGRLDVTNRCIETSGRVNEAQGIARQVEGQPPSVLEVRFAPAWLSFLPMVWGDYNIVALAPDYSHALVGSHGREYLWILAREPRLEAAVYDDLVETARSQGFAVERLIRTHQDPE